jgi:hypothetical protein
MAKTGEHFTSMSKWVGIGILIVSAFAVGFLAIIVMQRDTQRSAAQQGNPVPKPFEGTLAVYAIDDLRVANRRIALCGTAPPRPSSVWSLAAESMRRDFRGIALSCKPVGSGTPCDGKTGAQLGQAIVVQCLMPDGADLAAVLAQKGLLCGQAPIVGSLYKNC